MAIVPNDGITAGVEMCASETYGSPPTWGVGFDLLASTTDPHIETVDTDGTATPAVGTAVNPQYVDFTDFWLDSVADTDRPAHIPPSGSVGN